LVSGFEIGEGGEGVKKKRRGGVGTLGWRGEAGNGRIGEGGERRWRMMMSVCTWQWAVN
jgi:hypothetical protein